jgi:hypothetical protein
MTPVFLRDFIPDEEKRHLFFSYLHQLVLGANGVPVPVTYRGATVALLMPPPAPAPAELILEERRQ